jgi:hypothetical protein
LLNFLSSKSSDEDWSTIPYDLEHFSWRDLGNIDFEIGISIVSSPAVQPADDGHNVKPSEVSNGCVVDSIQHVDLSPSDISLVFVVYSVLVEPVVEVSLEIDVVSEVTRPC